MCRPDRGTPAVGRSERSTTAGTSPLDPAALRARFTELTMQEAQVLSLVALGRNNTEIAAELFIGVTTVKSHINTLFAKLGVRDRAQAMALARA